MSTKEFCSRFARIAIASLLAMAMTSPSVFAVTTPQPGSVDLIATPPDLTTSVDPNIVVTFDDSGSMASTFMGDGRPYDGQTTNTGSWAGPWVCANVLDPRATSVTNPLSRGMNGVYYNPNISYTPPLKPDGSSFPNADSTLKAVWTDGIAINKALNPVTAAAAAFNNNPSGAAASNSSAVTDLTGIYNVKINIGATKDTTAYSTTANCPLPFDSGFGCVEDLTKCKDGNNKPAHGCFWQYKATTTTTTDNRWMCSSATAGSGTWKNRNIQNPFDGTVTDPGGSGKPNGGPVYWRFSSAAAPQLTTDPTTGLFTAAAQAALYTQSNWEAVAVPAAQFQNFANWYAYYRYRNVMARTAMSRVFGVLGSNIRVAWQNLNDGKYQLPSSSIITNLLDKAGSSCATTDPSTSFGAGAQPDCFRSAFFNWIYQVPASGGTPSRFAAIRAGNFFKRTNSSDLKDPYWELAESNGTPAQELACRQNFHMLMTDGLYNNDKTATVPMTTASAQTLPGTPINLTGITAYAPGAAESKLYAGVSKDTDGGATYSDIAFYYWATNLRPDFIASANPAKVAPYFPDLTVGVTTGTAPVDASNPGSNAEVFWNPVNDPATWPHLVQFAVTLGAFGDLTYSTDVDCNQDDGLGVGKDDLCRLRKGAPTSLGVAGWPTPDGTSPGIAANIDDLWHAALNSRGSFFVATDPNALVSHLTDIISSILVRSTTSSQPTLSLAIATSNGASFSAGYDSADWSGNLTRKIPFDTNGNAIVPIPVWEAGCLLTGGTCIGGAKTARDQDTRVIFTYDGTKGVPFRWGSLSGAEQSALNINPASVAVSADPSAWTADGYGKERVLFLRGDRTHESGAAPVFRHRSSVLGAIINSQPLYISSPDSGWTDNWPTGSAEAVAAADTAATGNSGSYAKFVNNNKDRAATVYVGANDGMLHAFDAASGSESWAYVPSILMNRASGDSTPFTKSNLNLLRYTAKSTLVPTVNSTPTEQDVFINGAWHTVIVGSLGLGGRGVFAVDVTDPASVTESSAPVLWEYSNNASDGADLGYTYSKASIARLSSGKWVALVSSGYFPNGPVSETYNDPSSADPAANKTSLLVIDLTTGKLISELKTSSAPNASGVTTYGLSAPGVYDLGGDQVDDLVTAGDLAGNLWRFDLSDASPTNWKVDLMFQAYSTTADVGKYPISVTPVGMRVPATRGIVWIIGTGKFLGKDDRTSSIPTQAFYGVYDAGTNPAAPNKYPILPSDMLVQTVTEDSKDPANRFLTALPMLATNRGWTIPLNITTPTSEAGERNVVTATALDSSNRAILSTLIPTTNDPCNPGRRGALMVVDAASGGAGKGVDDVNGAVPAAGTARVGIVITSDAIPTTGDVTTYVPVGGGSIGIPGIPGDLLGLPDNYWHRGAWRELLDLL